MEDYITVKEAAIKWKVTERQVQILCKTNRSNGVQGVQTRLKRKDRFESK